MKKLLTFFLAMVMCVNLLACSGSGIDTQPAIDSYNQLCDNYNKFVELGNESIDEIDDETVDFFNDLVDVINEYGAQLESDTEFTQEEVDEMVEMFDELNDIIVEALENWEE